MHNEKAKLHKISHSQADKSQLREQHQNSKTTGIKFIAKKNN